MRGRHPTGYSKLELMFPRRIIESRYLFFVIEQALLHDNCMSAKYQILVYTTTTGTLGCSCGLWPPQLPPLQTHSILSWFSYGIAETVLLHMRQIRFGHFLKMRGKPSCPKVVLITHYVGLPLTILIQSLTLSKRRTHGCRPMGALN